MKKIEPWQYIKYDENKFINHLESFPASTLQNFKTKVYINTGLLIKIELLVFYSLYDIENLKKISRSIKENLIINILEINKTIDRDQGNTITNFTKPFNYKDEVKLIIVANYLNR